MASVKWLNESRLYFLEEGMVFDEGNILINFLTKTNLQDWEEIFSKIQPFSNLNSIKILVEFGFTLPGTNAPSERAFSILNAAWEEKDFKFSNISNILKVKYNSDFSCSDFANFLKSDKKLLQKIHDSDKY